MHRQLWHGLLGKEIKIENTLLLCKDKPMEYLVCPDVFAHDLPMSAVALLPDNSSLAAEKLKGSLRAEGGLEQLVYAAQHYATQGQAAVNSSDANTPADSRYAGFDSKPSTRLPFCYSFDLRYAKRLLSICMADMYMLSKLHCC